MFVFAVLPRRRRPNGGEHEEAVDGRDIIDINESTDIELYSELRTHSAHIRIPIAHLQLVSILMSCEDIQDAWRVHKAMSKLHIPKDLWRARYCTELGPNDEPLAIKQIKLSSRDENINVSPYNERSSARDKTVVSESFSSNSDESGEVEGTDDQSPDDVDDDYTTAPAPRSRKVVVAMQAELLIVEEADFLAADMEVTTRQTIHLSISRSCFGGRVLCMPY
jgi:hypothetical protein